MKHSKPVDLRNLSDDELMQQIRDNESALVDMRFRQAVGTLEDPSAFRVIRRDIARMKTILNERRRQNASA